jgi:hypothetical protein
VLVRDRNVGTVEVLLAASSAPAAPSFEMPDGRAGFSHRTSPLAWW